jgi:hypothetical protein
MAAIDKVAVVLPLYLYDHSGITMRTSPFSCPWDSGQVGWIYVPLTKVREEYGVKRVTKRVRDLVTKVLVQEVETYDQMLTGQVYGVIIEDEDGDQLDSLWGMYGDLDYVRAEGREMANGQTPKRLVDEAANSTQGAGI